ncbi:MAG: damage-inducible protein CinA [Gammaproteobacteria bacterium]|nr:MAG: damage-inducible protein CinA [Gammaproteobacteria bacterium]PIE36795.1 MAG: damage-inducible protein CinA [Gammaproteobacteria bacterium]
MIDDAAIEALSLALGQCLQARGFTITTAESCTGGLVAGAITAVAGSSEWFEQGFVTYANTAKQQLLGVGMDTLERHGAVSDAVVLEMLEGAAGKAAADVAVAVSGIAGPGGAVPGKPVGSVWVGWRWPHRNGEMQSSAALFRFDGNRAAVRRQAVAATLHGTIIRVDNPTD